MQHRKEKKPVETLLLDMYETIGKIEAQNELIIAEQYRANGDRSKILTSQAQIVRRMDAIDGGELERFEGGLKPKLNDFAMLKRQMALAVLILVGAVQIIVYAMTHLREIGAALRDILGLPGAK